jgi:DNA-directed RNA polymerase alpha subunit
LKATSSRLHECDIIQKELVELREFKKFYENQMLRSKEIAPELLKLLATPISKTKLSGRVKGVCNGGKIRTVLDLVRLNPIDFLKFRNCGKRCMSEVEGYFQEHGLNWNMDV